MQTWKGCVALVTLYCCGIALGLPFEVCKRSDKGECLKGAIQDALGKMINGIPEYDFPTINPINIPTMNIDKGKGPVQLVQKYTDVKLVGVDKAKLEKVEASIGPTSFTLDADAVIDPDLKLMGNYDFTGTVLLFPVHGVGNCTVTLMNLKVTLKFIGETFDKDGKTYSEIKDVKMTLKPAKVEFNFNNMLPGGKLTNMVVDKAVNSQWESVFEDVRAGYEESLSQTAKTLANLIFMKVPYDEMFPL